MNTQIVTRPTIVPAGERRDQVGRAHGADGDEECPREKRRGQPSGPRWWARAAVAGGSAGRWVTGRILPGPVDGRMSARGFRSHVCPASAWPSSSAPSASASRSCGGAIASSPRPTPTGNRLRARRRRRRHRPARHAPTRDRGRRRLGTAVLGTARCRTEAVVEDLSIAEVEVLPELEVPAPSAGRLTRLRARLARSQSTLGMGLLAILARERLDDVTWDEIEETLLTSDLGVAPTAELVDRLRTRAKVDAVQDPQALKAMLREELLALVDPDMDRSLHTAQHPDGTPAVVLVVGVNGTGKTTTTGKLARVLVADGRTVLLGAADTFRAAAAEQLTTWGDRVGATVVRGPEGADPASVAFDAVKKGHRGGRSTPS